MGRRKKGDPVSGWINLYKPVGITSTQAVGKIRRLLNWQKVGHAGTLDPLAEGILPIALGEATKTIPYIQDRAKIYEFTATWGAQTTTDDAEGDVIAKSDQRPSEQDIEALLPAYTGDIEQTPPRFSAIKIDGQRAYDLAREGQEVAMKARRVTVHSLEIINCVPREGGDLLSQKPKVPACAGKTEFMIHCGKGTYIRSLARDMGAELGCYGHVTFLKRAKVGPFTEEKAIFLDTLEEMEHSARLDEALCPLETALDDIPALAIKEDETARLRNGQALSLVSRPDFERLSRLGIDPKEECEILATCNGKPIAITLVKGPNVKPVKVFNI